TTGAPCWPARTAPPKPAVNSKPHWPSIHATPRRVATWNCSSSHEVHSLLRRRAAFGQLQVSRCSLVRRINRQRRPEHLHSLGKTALLRKQRSQIHVGFGLVRIRVDRRPQRFLGLGKQSLAPERLAVESQQK